MRYFYTSELYHHGIKGQKWGVRRYQNEDGTLTSEGRARYYDSNGNFTTDRKLRGEFYRENRKQYFQMKREQKRFVKDKTNEYRDTPEGKKIKGSINLNERRNNAKKIADMQDRYRREYAKNHIDKIYDKRASSFMDAQRKKRAIIAVAAVAALTLPALRR